MFSFLFKTQMAPRANKKDSFFPVQAEDWKKQFLPRLVFTNDLHPPLNTPHSEHEAGVVGESRDSQGL